MSPSRYDQPQGTIGEALDNGWTYLRLRCALCRHTGRIELRGFAREVSISGILIRARCPKKCTPGMVDAKIGYVSIIRHETPLGFENGRIFKIGMN